MAELADSEYLGQTGEGDVYFERGRTVYRRERECSDCGAVFMAERRGNSGAFSKRCTSCKPKPGSQRTWILSCQRCGIEFTINRTGPGRKPLYCSAECRGAAHDAQTAQSRAARPRVRKPRARRPHVCAICGVEIPARTNSRYCGDRCLAERDRRRLAAARASRAARTNPCVVCEDPIRLGVKYCKKAECQRVKNRVKRASYLAKPGVKERIAAQRRARRSPPTPRVPKPPPTAEDLARLKERDRERVRAYRQRHPERVKQASKRWQKANPELVREQRRKARAKKILANRKRVDAIKGDTCPKCKKKKPKKFLHFHHRDPATKYKGVSQMLAMSWSRIEAEIAKCDVLCADCHAEHHKTEALLEAGQLQLGVPS